MRPSDAFIAQAATQIVAAMSANLMTATTQDFPVEARNIAAGAWKIALLLHQEMPAPMHKQLDADDETYEHVRANLDNAPSLTVPL